MMEVVEVVVVVVIVGVVVAGGVAGDGDVSCSIIIAIKLNTS